MVTPVLRRRRQSLNQLRLTHGGAVPFFCPDTPPPEQNPVFLYFSDGFQKPNPFTADIAVSIDDVAEKKIDAANALVSQVYEGGALGSEETLSNATPTPP